MREGLSVAKRDDARDAKRVAEYIATKPRSNFQLLAPDPDALALALQAWRTAVLYYQRVAIEQSVDYEKFRRLDEFDPVAVFRENESYYAEKLLEAARHVLGRAAIGEAPSPLDPFEERMFTPESFAGRFGADTSALNVWVEVSRAREALKSFPGDERFLGALCEAETKRSV